ncbi:MAG: aromatic ring-hydroxylating dioxygenase subunit alpha [Gammaproteobacteria bacterium]|jgi:phenylpropionate dioxygenase-like ring-hydroxylating dioxygenase large terminal subunit
MNNIHEEIKINFKGFSGHGIALSKDVDDEITRVGPGAPAGEYLRRYWHPVFLSKDLDEQPVAIKILDEELVIFRDKSGNLGLVHKHCPHRQASLEFGMCTDSGIQCCYHGWHFAADGSILDVPGQPEKAADMIKQRVRLGAYPTHEYKGLIFAYMGPIESIPEFPVYDSFDFENMEMVPYKAPFACNWLQVLDAIVDPIHTAFLHSNVSRVQFSEGFGEVGQMDFFERESWILGCNTRRVGDNVWLRINEVILPNFTQAGSAFTADGTKEIFYGRSSFTRWVVPIDDETTICYAWANFGERGDPQEYNTPEGPELIEQGEVFDRPYEQKQKFPADVEACEGMGPITIHNNENLTTSDIGVALMRRQIREQIRGLSAGKEPMHVSPSDTAPIPTYGGDTVLNISRKTKGDELALLSKIAHEFIKIQFAVDGKSENKRISIVTDKLKEMQSRYNCPE